MQFLSVKLSLSGKTVISQFLNQGSFHFNHSVAPQFSHILESFIHVIMLGRTFRVKEKVQVLDVVTSIWESAVILSLISVWCVRIKWSDWPGNAISGVPEDRKKTQQHGIYENSTNTMIFVSSAEGRIREKIKHRSTPDGCTGTRWSFLNMLGVSKKGLSSSTTLSCPSVQFVWSTNLRILRGMDHHAVAIYTLGTPS